MIGMALALASAQPDVEMALRALDALDQRVANVAYALATKGAPLCPETQRASGLVLQDAAQYDDRSRPVAARLFGLGDYPVVMAQHGKGLQRGDAIIAFQGEAVGPADPKRPYDRIGRILAATESAPVRVTFIRGGRRDEAIVAGALACPSRAQLVPGRKLNATSDGTYVQLTSAVAEFASNDAELAFIIAHEMAHNILKHPDSRKRKRAAVRATEMEADRFALKLMQAAGFDPAAAAPFWARFGKKTGAGIFSDGTHMRTKARVAFLEAAAREAGKTGTQ